MLSVGVHLGVDTLNKLVKTKEFNLLWLIVGFVDQLLELIWVTITFQNIKKLVSICHFTPDANHYPTVP